MHKLLVMMLAVFLAACSGGGFQVKNLAKSDIDMVADAHYRESQVLLRELTGKLYRRNTREWRKSGLSLEKLTARIFNGEYEVVRDEQLNGLKGVEAIELALAPDYRGDRVFALMAGTNHMIRQSYNFQSEFFFLSELDEQKLYNSARNIEILVWRLSNTLKAQAENSSPIILTNSVSGEVANLSFERLFGKLIANQDMLAGIVAGKNQRVIKTVVHNVASMVFLPI